MVNDGVTVVVHRVYLDNGGYVKHPRNKNAKYHHGTPVGRYFGVGARLYSVTYYYDYGTKDENPFDSNFIRARTYRDALMKCAENHPASTVIGYKRK